MNGPLLRWKGHKILLTHWGIGKQSWKILTNLPEIGFGGFFTTTSLFEAEAEAVEAAGKLADVFGVNSCHL